jgi:hypothetical protein
MNADEVVRNTVAGLRVMSESGDWSVDRQTCTDAAALIESLTAQLAESRRREKAAVADLKHMDNCDICKHGQTAPDGCDCECDECTLPCVCRDCRNEDKWQWRGPSDGEKGETK